MIEKTKQKGMGTERLNEELISETEPLPKKGAVSGPPGTTRPKQHIRKPVA